MTGPAALIVTAAAVFNVAAVLIAARLTLPHITEDQN